MADKEIYLDNSATTKVFEEVVQKMNKIYLEDYGNPSSKHMKGVESENYLKQAREMIASSLKVNEKNILFTSGGTESDNTALFGIMRANKRRGNHFITTKIEHPAILMAALELEKEGFEVTYLNVDSNGQISLDELRNAIKKETVLVSIMHTNNEIGSLMPIEEAGKIIKEVNPDTYFHVDAVQGYGKAKIFPKRMKIDLLSVSAHKIHGPKGVGFLYIGDNVKIKPFVYGGGQQGNMRSGTENVPGIYGMAVASDLMYKNLDEDVNKLYELKEYLVNEISKLNNVKINGLTGRDSAPHIVSVSVKNVRAEVLLHALEEKGIYVSSGSACASNKNTVSDTLSAIKIDKDYMDSTIRISMSVFTTKEELEYTVEELRKAIEELSKFVRR